MRVGASKLGALHKAPPHRRHGRGHGTGGWTVTVTLMHRLRITMACLCMPAGVRGARGSHARRTVSPDSLAPAGRKRPGRGSRQCEKLDNRRGNLRVVTRAQNRQNTSSCRGSTSCFRGVHWAKDKKRWRVRPAVHGHYVHVGYFRTEIAAAMAAEDWRRKHMPFAEPDPELLRVVRSL